MDLAMQLSYDIPLALFSAHLAGEDHPPLFRRPSYVSIHPSLLVLRMSVPPHPTPTLAEEPHQPDTRHTDT